jgi:hypothetical protein
MPWNRQEHERHAATEDRFAHRIEGREAILPNARRPENAFDGAEREQDSNEQRDEADS